jgi:hypothetical protein
MDGALSVQPQLMNPGADFATRAVADSARRAIQQCAPFRLPPNLAPPGSYDDWKDWTITFDPKDMLG